jgi:hypothetical protein
MKHIYMKKRGIKCGETLYNYRHSAVASHCGGNYGCVSLDY